MSEVSLQLHPPLHLRQHTCRDTSLIRNTSVSSPGADLQGNLAHGKHLRPISGGILEGDVSAIKDKTVRLRLAMIATRALCRVEGATSAGGVTGVPHS